MKPRLQIDQLEQREASSVALLLRVVVVTSIFSIALALIALRWG
jgi:hypothetical protein